MLFTVCLSVLHASYLHIMLVSGFRCRTTCRSHLRHLKTGPRVCPEKSLRNYHYSLCNNPEEHNSLLLLPAHYVLQVNCASCISNVWESHWSYPGIPLFVIRPLTLEYLRQILVLSVVLTSLSAWDGLSTKLRGRELSARLGQPGSVGRSGTM
jgi:hypothetical protein